MSEACAAIVERDDPHLYATALFAAEPARSRLMVLYAFDCELSRATHASKESLIPRMRLQWWQDVVEEACQGKAQKAHEVAAPLNDLIQTCETLKAGDDLRALIEVHGQVLGLPWAAGQESQWRLHRFQRLITAASRILTDTSDAPPAVGPIMADAFALRHARRMAVGGEPTLIPRITGSDLAALARGELTDTARNCVAQIAKAGLADLKTQRATTRQHDPHVVPALLPLLWAERVLGLVARDPSAVLGQLDDIDRPFDGLRLAWRAARGRW